MNDQKNILIAQSHCKDPAQAVKELYEGIAQPNISLVLFFCCIGYDRTQLAAAINQRFEGLQVLGCTTAGEIGPLGFCENNLVGVSFSEDICTAVAGLLENLQEIQETSGYVFAQKLLQQLENKAQNANYTNSFGLLMIDGLSVREEIITRILQTVLGKTKMIGGSTGDGLNFKHTHVFYHGKFHPDSAILILISTKLPFKIFKTQHFEPTEERMVVTEADTANRIVMEINGLPAAQEYARIAGVGMGDLSPMFFAATPVMVLINGGYYIRSIRSVNVDQSLTFYCTIEEGLVLRVAKGVDFLENLRQAFANIHTQIGRPQFVLGYDCVYRKLEALQCGLIESIEEIFRYNNSIGFNTYGEQFAGVHVNQTLVGVAIGYPEHHA